MGPWVGALIGALIQVAGTLVGKVLISLGIGYAVYSGVDTSLTWAKAQVISSISGAGAQAVAAAGALKLGKVISILFSALVARLTLNGMTSGTIKKMVLK